MNKKLRLINMVIVSLLLGGIVFFSDKMTVVSAQTEKTEDPALSGKKILYINSYHAGYPWSDGIIQGILQTLKITNKNKEGLYISSLGLILKIVEMDTKRNSGEKFKTESGRKVNQIIKDFKPDLVITSDDNAFKYVIMPFHRDGALPVVFCGLNWDASIYEAPYTNTTGMVEVALVDQLINQLKTYVKGKRIGYLGPKVLSAQKEAENYKKILKLDLVEKYVENIKQWKKDFTDLQKNVDILIVYNNAGIDGWDDKDVAQFVLENTVIPTGATLTHMAKFCVVTIARDEQEQGEYAATTALAILKGKKPSKIPVVENKRAKIFLNMKLAKKIKIKIPMSLIEHSTFVE